jgi:osmotically-inducible protein OsmY
MTALVAPRFPVLLAAALGLFAALPGCAPTVESLGESLGSGAADTASEERTTGEVDDDTKIEIELDKLLADDGFGPRADLGILVYRGRVLLLGSVETADAKARAGEIGGAPEGVTEVINDIQVTDADGAGAHLNDLAIEKSIQTDYLFGEGIDSRNFRVRSVDGTVYLIGQAGTQAELDKVLRIARETEDVRRVVNHVRIVEFSGSCGCEKPPAPLRKRKP